MPQESWRVEDMGQWNAASESGTDMEATLATWGTALQSRFPERLAHLVWDRERIRRLEEAVDEVVRDDHDCPAHLVAFFRRTLVNRLTGLGPLEPLLLDDSITEIMVNGECTWVERDGVITSLPVEFYSGEEVQDLARRIANRAGRELNTENPLCDALLSDGSRIHCVLPPVSEVPTITIRRAATEALSLRQFLDSGSFSVELWEDLAAMVKARRNLIIAGGASTGKTSLLRLLAENIPETERLVTIEEVRELNVPHANTVRLEAFRQFTVRDLVKNALRMRPDRIIVGEVRGPEALDLIDAMSSGHPGSLCTVHGAPGPERTMDRLARMALQQSLGLTFDAVRNQITDAIEVIVYLVREGNGRRRVDSVWDISPVDIKPRWQWDGSVFHRRGK